MARLLGTSVAIGPDIALFRCCSRTYPSPVPLSLSDSYTIRKNGGLASP